MNPATPLEEVHRDGDGAHAGAERRCQEATIFGPDERTASDRLAGRNRIANDGSGELLPVRLVVLIIGALHELLRPRLTSEHVASMMVPTGSAVLATRTFGPTGTAGAAAACWAPAPANMFLAITAVTTAMTKAPTSRATFFTSMARSPPPDGSSLQPHSSGKLVKKTLGENRETAERDRDSVRNLRPTGRGRGRDAARARRSSSTPPASDINTRNFTVDPGENHSASAAASLTSPPPIMPA